MGKWLVLLMLAGAALARDGWVTFKTGSEAGYGRVAYQTDAASIRPQGAYKTFAARALVLESHQPLAFSVNEQLYFLSQTYVVDCTGHRFGSRFIASNMPAQRRRAARLEKMRWIDLQKVPAVARTVCGGK